MKEKLGKVVLLSFGILFCLAIVFLSCLLIRYLFIDGTNWIEPLPGQNVEDWTSQYLNFLIGIGLSSLLAYIIWYTLGQWGFPVVNRRSAGRRFVWLILLTIPAIAFIIACLFTVSLSSGYAIACACYILVGFLCYYIPSLIASPHSFKYTPFLAVHIRRW